MDNRSNDPQINSGSIIGKSKFSQYLTKVTMGPIDEFKHVPVTSNEMVEIFKSLRNKNSSGYDEVSTNVLKASMPYILSPLIYICNRSLSTGIFPSRLKYSQVHPIYKKGARREISNYRPISVLPSFSKIFEKGIFNRLLTYVSDNNILDADQYGFRNSVLQKLTCFLTYGAEPFLKSSQLCIHSGTAQHF
jgi:hypothetical protein